MPEVSSKTRLEVRQRPNEVAVMHQDWRDLLFLHWKYDANEIQKTLPPGLFVDTFEGNGYVTIIPFSMENLSLANMPSLPGFSDFIEVNVRTYVYDKNGIPGIWFYSLDLNSVIGVNVARNTYYLPYFYADLKKVKTKMNIVIQGHRIDQPHLKMQFVYQPKEEASHFAENDTIDFFLIERYALFSFASNQLNIGRVHHQPYPITQVNVLEWSSELLEESSIELFNKSPDFVHYSPGVDVDIFSLKKV